MVQRANVCDQPARMGGCGLGCTVFMFGPGAYFRAADDRSACLNVRSMRPASNSSASVKRSFRSVPKSDHSFPCDRLCDRDSLNGIVRLALLARLPRLQSAQVGREIGRVATHRMADGRIT